MDSRIPDDLKFLFQKYVQLLHANFGDVIYGVYVYGSLALGSYKEKSSNIDFMTIIDKKLTEDDILRIKAVHKALRKVSPFSSSLEGEYVYLRDIGAGKPEKKYPYFAFGRYYGEVCIKSFDWFQLKHCAITIYGEDIDKIDGNVNFTDVKKELARKLNDYWVKAADRNYILLFDNWISMIVLTLCRIYYTLENEMVISKGGGGKFALESVDKRWHSLINEALRIHNRSSEKSEFPSKLKRLQETKEFIRFVVDYCNDKYQLEYL